MFAKKIKKSHKNTVNTSTNSFSFKDNEFNLEKITHVPKALWKKIIYYIFYPLYLKDIESNDKRANMIVMLIIQFGLVVIVGLIGTFPFLKWYQNKIPSWYIPFDAHIMVIVVIINTLFMKRWFELNLFVFTLAVYVECIVLYFSKNEGNMMTQNVFCYVSIIILSSNNFFFLLVQQACLPFFTLLLSKKWYIKAFWMIMIFLSIMMLIIHNFFVYPNLWNLVLFKHESNGETMFAVFVYTYLFPAGLVVLVCYFYFSLRSKREQTYIIDIAESISKLEIRNPILLKLQRKRYNSCNDIEKMFKGIISNLEEYVNYLPANLKEKNYINDDKSSTICESGDDINKKTDSSTSRVSSNLNKSDYTNETVKTRSTGSTRDSRETTKSRLVTKNEYTNLGLVCKDVTYMVIFIPSLFEQIDTNERNDSENLSSNMESSFTEYHKFIQKICYCVKLHTGIVDEIYNNYIIATWNELKMCIKHVEMACSCATDIIKACNNKKFIYENRFRIVISTGECFCGNVGGNMFKRYVKISKIIPITHALKNVCVVNNNKGSDIIITQDVYKAVQYISCTKIVNIVHLKPPGIEMDNMIVNTKSFTEMKANNKLNNNYKLKIDFNESTYKKEYIKIYRLLNMKNINEKEEWMYQISSDVEKQEETPETINSQLWNKVWEEIMNSNFNFAEDLIRKNFMNDEDNEFALNNVINKIVAIEI